jgi:hypothetical protein
LAVKLFPDTFLNAAGAWRIMMPKLADFGRDCNPYRSIRFGELPTITDGFDTVGANPPLGDQPVCRQPAMQMAGGCAVLIVNIAACNGAESFNIKKRILDFERINRPLD